MDLVDGCTRFGAFIKIVLPQLAPGLVAAGLIVFVYVWNKFIIAVSLASKQDMRLISVGLYFYLSDFGIQWGKIAAGAIISILPPAALFLFCCRRIEIVEHVYAGAAFSHEALHRPGGGVLATWAGLGCERRAS